MRITNKHILFLGLISFFILFFISFYFYQERVVYFDTAFQLFKIINFQDFNLEANRYSTLITQIPVLLGLKIFHLPIKWLMIILSASYILVFFIVYLLIIKNSDNIYLSLSLILILVSNITQFFYFSASETHQALAYCTLLFSLLFVEFKQKFFHFISLFITILLAFYSHPVAFFCIIYALGYYLVDKKVWKNYTILSLILITILLLILKLITTEMDSYEGSFFKSLITIFSEEKTQFYSVVYLLRNFSLFWVNYLSFIILIFYLYHKSDKLKLIYIFFSFIIFFIITIITYRSGDADVMMERAYMPLSYFSILPMFFELEKNDKWNKLILFLFIIIFGVSTVRIFNYGLYLNNGLNNNLNYLVNESLKKGNHKILIEESKYNFIPEINRWSIPFNSLMYSVVNYNECVTIKLVNNCNEFKQYINDKNKCNIMLGADFWLEWNTHDFNTQYFKFPPCENYKCFNQ